jgi:hypothetical protein
MVQLRLSGQMQKFRLINLASIGRCMSSLEIRLTFIYKIAFNQSCYLYLLYFVYLKVNNQTVHSFIIHSVQKFEQQGSI